ncbi:cellular tumor antigen p53 [Halyomorpha halys]|uniref:cellular tumor antigen p53 n=1 Tax=Halyomorpha halys TaxID=286706 RepID=UPI0006D50C0C|nr:cellular tumor antigen p53 [Halyomorpha halys]
MMDSIKMKYECDSTERKIYPLDFLPSLEDYPGYYDFSIDINQSQQGKSSCFYSKILKQVFIDMNKMLLIHFQLSGDVTGLFIRALPVYASPDFSGIPVTRCTVHSVESDPKGKAHSSGFCNCSKYENVGHVIRSQSSDAQYYYDDLSRRHSVLVPIRKLQVGSQSFPIGYFFSCKTSCPGGMQRRPINIIFTLETACGDVLGRRVLGVRICSCPKRDMERLEKDHPKGKKRHYERPSKKIKYSPSCSYLTDDSDNITKLSEEMNDLNKILIEFHEKVMSLSHVVNLL